MTILGVLLVLPSLLKFACAVTVLHSNSQPLLLQVLQVLLIQHHGKASAQDAASGVSLPAAAIRRALLQWPPQALACVGLVLALLVIVVLLQRSRSGSQDAQPTVPNTQGTPHKLAWHKL